MTSKKHCKKDTHEIVKSLDKNNNQFNEIQKINLNLKKKSSLQNFRFPQIQNMQKNNHVKSMKLLSTCQLRPIQKNSQQSFHSKLQRRFNKKFYLKSLNTQNFRIPTTENQQSNKATDKLYYQNSSKNIKKYSSCNKFSTLGSLGSIEAIPQIKENQQKNHQTYNEILRHPLCDSKNSLNLNQSKVNQNFQRVKSKYNIRKKKEEQIKNQIQKSRQVKSSNSIQIRQYSEIQAIRNFNRQKYASKCSQNGQGKYLDKVNYFRRSKFQIFEKLKKVERIPLKKIMRENKALSKTINVKTTLNLNIQHQRIQSKKIESQNSIELQEPQGFETQKPQQSKLNKKQTFSNVSIKIEVVSPEKQQNKKETQNCKNKSKTHNFFQIQPFSQHHSIFPSSTKAKVLIRNPFPKSPSHIIKNNKIIEKDLLSGDQADQDQNIQHEACNNVFTFDENSQVKQQFKQSKIYHNDSVISAKDRNFLQQLINLM